LARNKVSVFDMNSLFEQLVQVWDIKFPVVILPYAAISKKRAPHQQI